MCGIHCAFASFDLRLWRTWRTNLLPRWIGFTCKAYLKMGAKGSFTCAPYLLDTAPEQGDHIGWGESNAVVFANSVLGARNLICWYLLNIILAQQIWCSSTNFRFSKWFLRKGPFSQSAIWKVHSYFFVDCEVCSHICQTQWTLQIFVVQSPLL